MVPAPRPLFDTRYLVAVILLMYQCLHVNLFDTRYLVAVILLMYQCLHVNHLCVKNCVACNHPFIGIKLVVIFIRKQIIQDICQVLMDGFVCYMYKISFYSEIIICALT